MKTLLIIAMYIALFMWIGNDIGKEAHKCTFEEYMKEEDNENGQR